MRNNPETWSQLIFNIFAYIADGDKSITPREIKSFNETIADSHWTDNPPMLAALERLRAGYSTLWAAYEKSGLTISLSTIKTELTVACAGMSHADAKLFYKAVGDFVQKIPTANHRFLEKFGMDGGAVAKQRAKKKIKYLLFVASIPDENHISVKTETEFLPVIAETSMPPPEQTEPVKEYPVSAVDADLWTGGRLKVMCIKIIEETHDVKSYIFSSNPEKKFSYKPGQFVTLELSIDGKLVRRSYTISSSPSRPNNFSITVKRVPSGLVSNWLYENMQVGSEIFINGPSGKFSCIPHARKKLLMISGGSGVTPLMSMLRWLADTAADVEVIFINNVRSPADIIFEQELHYLSTRFGESLKLFIVPGRITPGRAWNGLTGSFNETLLRTVAPDFAERQVYVCGPVGYMQMVESLLEKMQFPMSFFSQESFGGAPSTTPKGPPPTTSLAPPPLLQGARPFIEVKAPARGEPPAPARGRAEPLSASTRLVFNQSGKSFSCAEGDFILEVAQRNGLDLDSSCLSGRCGVCKLKKVSGLVRMDGQEALSDDEIKDGFVLACIGQVCGSQVVLDA